MPNPKSSTVVAKMQDVKINTFSHSTIDQAFAERPDLRQRIYDIVPKLPRVEDLFIDIAEFILEKRNHPEAEGSKHGYGDDVQGAKKKRKLDALKDSGGGGGGGSVMFEAWKEGSWAAIKDISFSIPQRKKLSLEIGFLPEQGLRGRNVASDEIEFAVRWKDIQHVVCLPVPEKAQAQYNFCIFPLNGDGTNPVSSDGAAASEQQILWTAPNTVVKSTQVSGEITVESEDTYKSLLLRVLNGCLGHFGKQVVVPNEKEFASQTNQAHRKGDKAVHVKAFRGSKDGFLFFLPTGIFWGFKKPLIFFAFDCIDSVSYTSVLQRTFNLSITSRNSLDDTIEFDFSMVDQADFGGIDAYVKRHRLQDASMAEQRRAKILNINGVKNEDDEDEKENEEGDLEKARRELEDAEDAEEDDDENFDPGSEGESEGSGSSSEEEGEQEGHGEDQGHDGNLVHEELGSEAEDVEDE